MKKPMDYWQPFSAKFYVENGISIFFSTVLIKNNNINGITEILFKKRGFRVQTGLKGL